MNRDEKPTTDETKPRELIKDEVSDLLELYKLENPTREAVETALVQHLTEFGHVGFSSEIDEEAIDNFYAHFTKNSREYLEAELHFIQEVLSTDLNTLVEQGINRARALLPDQEYFNPQAVFLFNGKRTDAKVMGNGQFGINLQNLFSKVYSKQRKAYDVRAALKIIRNNSAHEATHVLEEQVEHSEDDRVNSLISGAFSEGLATFAQEEFDYPWSSDYFNDSEITLEIIRETFEGAPNEKILTDLCNTASLKKHKPDDVDAALKLISEGPVPDELFRSTLLGLLTDKNGPLYYAGYAVWKKIYETEGIEKIREIVKQGHNAFLGQIIHPK